MATRVIGRLALGIVLAAIGGGVTRADDAPRIKWERGVYAGFQKAIAEKKLLVVYFRLDYSGAAKGPSPFCTAVEEVLRGKGAADFADAAAWAWQTLGDEDDKGNAARLMKDLKVERYPTLVVLEVTADSIRERGRIVGSFPEQKYVEHLGEVFRGGKPEGRPAGAVPRLPATGRP